MQLPFSPCAAKQRSYVLSSHHSMHSKHKTCLNNHQTAGEGLADKGQPGFSGSIKACAWIMKRAWSATSKGRVSSSALTMELHEHKQSKRWVSANVPVPGLHCTLPAYRCRVSLPASLLLTALMAERSLLAGLTLDCCSSCGLQSGVGLTCALNLGSHHCSRR